LKRSNQMAHSDYQVMIVPMSFDENQLTNVIKNSVPPDWELISIAVAKENGNDELIIVMGKS